MKKLSLAVALALLAVLGNNLCSLAEEETQPVNPEALKQPAAASEGYGRLSKQNVQTPAASAPLASQEARDASEQEARQETAEQGK
ncbi:MAG TPA: hypothetical protein V6C99_03165 [Oculatellaceae cyanobacterium]|jgi:hypothetical protein